MFWRRAKHPVEVVLNDDQLAHLEQFIETCVGEAIQRQDDRIEKRLARAVQKSEGQSKDGSGLPELLEAGAPARKYRA